MTRKILATLLSLLLCGTLAHAQVPGQFLGGTVYGNNTTAKAIPIVTSAPVLGRSGQTGTLGFRGTTSGTVTVTPAAIAGTWTFTWPATAGTNGQALTTNGSGVASWTSITATPGGSTTQLQFNTSGALDGSANLTWVSPALSIGVAGSSTGILKLTGSTSGTISLKGANAAGTWTFTLPTTTGTLGQVLTTDGAGVSSWTTVSAAAAGSATQLQFNTAGALAASANLTWTSPALTIGAAGVTGALKIPGSTSGTATIQALATAGTPTLTLPNASGTFAISATSPLSLSATTGALTLPGTAGMVLAGASPAFTATPVLGAVGTLGSIGLSGNTSGVVTLSVQAAAGTWTMKLPTGVGSAGQILTTDGAGSTSWANAGAATAGGSDTQVQFNNATALGGSANLTWVSPKLTIGAAGSTAGQLAFANATSGSITVQAPTGALGSSVLSLPIATDTLVGKATTDALTNKTYNGLTLTAGASSQFTLGASSTLTIAAGKAVVFNNGDTYTSAGGGGNTFTFPNASFTVAGLSLANAFTSTNSFSGVTTFTGGLVVPMRVITAAGAVTVAASTDYFICVNKTSGAATVVNLPAGVTGQTFLIKDCKGDAATNNITITPASGNIDGASTYVLSTNLSSAAVTYSGAAWFVN